MKHPAVLRAKLAGMSEPNIAFVANTGLGLSRAVNTRASATLTEYRSAMSVRLCSSAS